MANIWDLIETPFGTLSEKYKQQPEQNQQGILSSWVKSVTQNGSEIVVTLKNGSVFNTPVGDPELAEQELQNIILSPSIGTAVSAFWRKYK